MYLNGSIAYVEDVQPGGFDNPEGTETADYAKGKGVIKFAITSLAVTVILASIGCLIQGYW